MLYAILCYHEGLRRLWSKDQDEAVMKKLAVVQENLSSRAGSGRGRLLADHGCATRARKTRRWCLMAPMPRPRSSCSASIRRLQECSMKPSRRRATSARLIPRGP